MISLSKLDKRQVIELQKSAPEKIENGGKISVGD